MKIKEMLEVIIDKGKTEDMYRLNDMLDELICDLKNKDPKMYKEYKMRLYTLAYGNIILPEKAEEWVKAMKPRGEHWTMEQTNDAMKRMNFNCDKVDFYIAANMMMNDYFNVVKDDEELALKMAYDFIKDEDSVEDKLFQYWLHIAKQ